MWANSSPSPSWATELPAREKTSIASTGSMPGALDKIDQRRAAS
jgi:hypothetical protein